MLAISGIVISIGLIAVMQARSLLRKKMVKELWYFFIFLTIGLALAIAFALDMKIPNPLDAVIYIYSPMSKWVASWVGK